MLNDIIYDDLADAFERWSIEAEAVGDIPAWASIRLLCIENVKTEMRKKLQSIGVKVFI